ncbi:MAG: ATP-dependent helicase [Deltaproteobacteria bacterium]|nr:MAG: ATP-dependent helicase [Deltaproteobacteria bacterium]
MSSRCTPTADAPIPSRPDRHPTGHPSRRRPSATTRLPHSRIDGPPMARTYTLRDTGSSPRRTLDLEARLNPQQRQVVEAPGGPMLVIAGAGTGKTHTITWRVARLIEDGVAPERILLLTFTNRAAREMLGRVEDLLGVRARAVWGGTFHGIARRLLREHATSLGYPENFTILDSEDAASLMKACIHARTPRRSDLRFPRAELVLRLFSATINTGRPLGDLLLDQAPQFEPHLEDLETLHAEFTARKVELGMVDFDDLLLLWARLLDEHPELATRARQRFDHVLVDEYQDTNRLQAHIIDEMVRDHRNLAVVGDDAQSIYAFRGAEYTNILRFEERYPDATRYLLEINYRSSPEVLDLANRSIAHNARQFPKTLRSEQPHGPTPALVECTDEHQQSQFVAQRILELRDEDIPLERIAVLYRAHRHAMELQLELSRRNIPFIVRSGMRFFEQRHIKDVLAFLRWVENPRDELAFRRVATLAEGVGDRTAEKLFLFLSAFDDPAAALADPRVERIVPSRGRRPWRNLSAVLQHLATPLVRSQASAAIDHVRDAFYDAWARQAFDSSTNRITELQTLAAYAEQHGDVAEFLDNLSLAGVLTGEDATAGPRADEYVVLSSIHQAKGLEFNAVFVLWLAEDRFPSARALLNEDDLEEERRLFYVAVTRAQRDLYLTRPMIAWEREHGRVVLRPSPFLRELTREPSPPPWERWTLASD